MKVFHDKNIRHKNNEAIGNRVQKYVICLVTCCCIVVGQTNIFLLQFAALGFNFKNSFFLRGKS